MKLAVDFRKTARNALNGKWLIAVVVGLVAVLLGAIGNEGLQVNLNIDHSNIGANLSIAGQTIFSTGQNIAINPDVSEWIVKLFPFFAINGIIMTLIYFVVGGFVSVGYAKFNLNLNDQLEAKFETLFNYFSYWKTTTLARFLKSLFISLWTLLFIIPGIVAGYSYAMTSYILAENPQLKASEAIKQSKAMMYGHRFRLFCLHFSFIGWDILVALSFGIGSLWITPYKHAATAAFYREISNTQSREAEFALHKDNLLE